MSFPKSLLKSALLALISTAPAVEAKAKHNSVAAVQPAAPRLDVIGVANDNSIWHKYDASGKGEWSNFESLSGASEDYPPVLTSWDAKRLDIFYIGDGSSVYHTYSGNGGKQWAIDETTGSPKANSKVAAVAREPGYVDLVVRTNEFNYSYKSWSSDADPEDKWFDLGGTFASAPAVASWAPDRLDLIGIDNTTRNIYHRFAYKVASNDTKLAWAWDWADLGGGPFQGEPFVSSWGPGRLDIWGIGEDGQLNHKYLYNRGGDWWEWSGWEQLGGNFATTPVVVSWDVAKFTIVGKYANETQYRQKDLYDDNGNWWHPSVDGWYEKGGNFTVEPAVTVTKGQNRVYIFGVDEGGVLKIQLFDGSQWLPSSDSYYDLGDLSEIDDTDGLLFQHQDLKA